MSKLLITLVLAIVILGICNVCIPKLSYLCHCHQSYLEHCEYPIPGGGVGDLLLEADASFGCPRNKYTCIRACKARKFTTGYCRGSVCRCKKNVCPSLPKACRLLCYRHGYKRGYCSGSSCRCYRKACPNTSLYCDYSCRIDKRFFMGKCFGSRCLCYMRRG